MRPDKKNKQEQSGRNNVFVIDIEEITVCHLGDISHVPTQSQVEDMGSIDVLLVPVGGKSALNATQAAEVISLIEPYVVIPMHYNLPNLTIEFDPVSKFLKEMGISKMDTVDSLKITKSGLPQETQVVVLEAKQ
jgi:L-ascorbate metabolism protein UlaG (beta-lactamase superfamily)